MSDFWLGKQREHSRNSYGGRMPKGWENIFLYGSGGPSKNGYGLAYRWIGGNEI